MEKLAEAGKIRRWGVSNFDTADMNDLFKAGGQTCATNQILYNISRRGCEFDLLPQLRRQNIPVMAYSPIEQGRLAKAAALKKIADARGLQPLQIALAWVLAREETLVIPKAATTAHVRENVAAASIELHADEIEALDQAFPPPRRKSPLEML